MALLRTELGKAGRHCLKETKATSGQNQKGFGEGGSRHSCPLTFRPEETRKLIEAGVTPDNKRTGGEETPLTESRVPGGHPGHTIRARPWALANRTVTGQADNGQKRSRVQCALRKLSLGCPEDRTLQPGCCWAVRGEYGVLPTGEVSHCIQTPLSPPQWQHRSCSMGISTESSQFSQDEEDLVIAGQRSHKQQKKKRGYFYERAMLSSYLPQESQWGTQGNVQ